MSVNCRYREKSHLLFNMRAEGDGRPRFIRTPALEEEVLHGFHDNPNVSNRIIPHQLRTGRTYCLANCKLCIHLQVYVLGRSDYPLHVYFARWFQQQRRSFPNFLKIVMFTDESCFKRKGLFNNSNNH